ncbi:perforin-1-like [Macrotis lagotis]|uniref:perforin-1-like n=1 Tax=Macrotis lagotis TaxID=92651 RepID=UPI003D696DC1
MMWPSSASLLIFFIFHMVLQLSRPTAAHCQTATQEECHHQKGFVPGWDLAGEGMDVTTLRRTGYFPVDTHKFQHPDGTCTLCYNDLQEGQLQRLPLAITDWHTQGTMCERNIVKTEASSVVEVATEMSKKIQNDWKQGLKIRPKPGINIKMSVAASHSKEVDFAAGKAKQDKYSFTIDTVQCGHYRFHLVRRPPLTQEFLQALKSLPHKFNTSTSADYYQFINNYGTHFLKSVELGGRATDITALRTCELALDGLKSNEVSACLQVEAAVTVGVAVPTSEIKKCEEDKKKHNIKVSFHNTYSERKVEVEGGVLKGGSSELLFSDQDGSTKFSEWTKSLSSKPGLVSYALEPLHFLLESKNPWREELKQAVSHYVNSRARWQDCNKPCPPGQKKNSRDLCQCVCQASIFTNGDCCPRERGLAHLEVSSFSAIQLRGDIFTPTDAYIKAFFGNKELRTPVIWNSNNPKWDTKMDFGTVQLVMDAPLRVQVWDKDLFNDEFLGSCDYQPMVGGQWEQCHFQRGALKFHYQVTCGPQLTGVNCLEYAPRGALGEPVGNRSGAVW